MKGEASSELGAPREPVVCLRGGKKGTLSAGGQWRAMFELDKEKASSLEHLEVITRIAWTLGRQSEWLQVASSELAPEQPRGATAAEESSSRAVEREKGATSSSRFVPLSLSLFLSILFPA